MLQVVKHSGFESETFSSHYRVWKGEIHKERLEDPKRDRRRQAKSTLTQTYGPGIPVCDGVWSLLMEVSTARVSRKDREQTRTNSVTNKTNQVG